MAVLRIDFQLVGNGNPGEEVPRFEVSVATGISGFSLEVDLLDLTQNPRGVNHLPTTPDLSAPVGTIALEGAVAVPVREFYQIRAMGRHLP